MFHRFSQAITLYDDWLVISHHIIQDDENNIDLPARFFPRCKPSRIFVLCSDCLISVSTQDRFFTLVFANFSYKSRFNYILGTTRAEVECIEESGTPVDDKYCKATPRPDDKQKTCNENQCPPT